MDGPDSARLIEQGKIFLAGGAGGISLVITGHPLDTIKVRLQSDGRGLYKGVVDCARQAVGKEGPLALYKGIVPPLVATTPTYAFCFYGYNVGKTIFCDKDAYDPKNLKLVQIGFAAAVSAVFTTPIVAPQELFKCVLQVQADKSKFKGSADVARFLYKEGGIKALTRGSGVTLMRDGIGSIMFFSWYEFMKAKLSDVPGLNSEGNINFGGVLIAGGVAGLGNWIPTIPIDRLKTKLQSSPVGQYSGAVFGSKSVLKEVMSVEGVPGLFKGWAPILLLAVLRNAACFCGYEAALSFLNSIT